MIVVLAAVAAFTRDARAEGGAPPGQTPAPALPAAPSPRRVEVRLSLSRAAADALGELRVRRLFEIELDDTGSLAASVGGPLGDQVAHVWIDLSSPSQVLIEARLAERAVTRRFITIGGLNADVAARLVAITANELVRAQARPSRPRKPPAPRAPTAAELEQSTRAAPAIVWSAAPSFAYVPAMDGALWGAGASLGFRGKGASERAFARWLSGPTTGGASRWLEVGLALDYRIWLGPKVRLALGADAAFSFVRLSSALDRDLWSGRAGGLFGIDVRAFGPTWIGLHVSPGAILRPASFEDTSGARGAVEGFFLGVDLALQIEHPLFGSPQASPR